MRTAPRVSLILKQASSAARLLKTLARILVPKDTLNAYDFSGLSVVKTRRPDDFGTFPPPKMEKNAAIRLQNVWQVCEIASELNFLNFFQKTF